MAGGFDVQMNASQNAAVEHVVGPMLVLAGPGSGKTMVITERTCRLITQHHIPPTNILVITFTKAAAGEMKLRFARRMEGNNYPVTFGTFHAVFFQILKQAYGFRSENIIREEMKYQLLRAVLTSFHADELPLEYEDEKEFIRGLLAEISLVKNTGGAPRNWSISCCSEELFQQIFKQYDQQMKRARLIDFDDMLVYCYDLLRQREDICKGWQSKFQYILIDEFQDINQLQFDIIKLLAKPQNNLFVVGDDDQSIYRFRGAKPELMLKFEEEYQTAKRVVLDTNYRSVPGIVTFAMGLIGVNQERFDKNIHAHREGDFKPEIRRFETQAQQNRQVVAAIQQYREAGGRYQDIAVLFRINTQPRLLMEQLVAFNIPFTAKDLIPNLYDHWIAKDIGAYIRLALGSWRRKDFLQIMNRPKRYIVRESIEEEIISPHALAEYFYAKKQPWIGERIEQLEADTRVLSRISPFAAINYIRNGIGYEDYLVEYAKNHRIKTEELLDVLEELSAGAKGYHTYQEWYNHQAEYKKEMLHQQKEQIHNRDGVSLATLHSAKGLEYPYVIIVDVNEGIMPYKKAVLPAELEEERRMFYVGVTRAKERLSIFYSASVNGKEMLPSRFLTDLPPAKK